MRDLKYILGYLKYFKKDLILAISLIIIETIFIFIFKKLKFTKVKYRLSFKQIIKKLANFFSSKLKYLIKI